MSELPAASGPAALPNPRQYAIPGAPPFWCYVFLAANIAVFVLQQALGWGLDARWPLVIQLLGAKINAAIIAGEYWRFVTALFLHGNLVHVAVNCYTLYIIGPEVEAAFGHGRFAALYMLAGVCSILASFLFTDANSVGASGALFGLMGALAVYLLRNRAAFGAMGKRRLQNIGSTLLLNLGLGLLPFIDSWAHAGGLAGGAALAAVIAPRWALEPGAASGQPQVVDANRAGTAGWVLPAAAALVAAAAVLAARLAH